MARAQAGWYGEPLAQRVGRLLGRGSQPVPRSRSRSGLAAIWSTSRCVATRRLITRGCSASGHLAPRAGSHARDRPGNRSPGRRCRRDSGFERGSARQAMHWSAARIALHTGVRDVSGDHRGSHCRGCWRRSGSSPSVPTSSSSTPRAAGLSTAWRKRWITHLHKLQVVLYHRGQLDTQPRKLMPELPAAACVLAPRMQTVAEKWLAARRLTDRACDGRQARAGGAHVRRLAAREPIPRSPRSQRSRGSTAWTGSPTWPQRRPRGPASRWALCPGFSGSPDCRSSSATPPCGSTPDVPGHTLIGAGDAPKYPQKVPRFIPEHELEQLMPVIDAIACPFQRARAAGGPLVRRATRRDPPPGAGLPGPLPRRHGAAAPVGPQDLPRTHRAAARRRGGTRCSR